MKDFKVMTGVVLSHLRIDKLLKIEGKWALGAEHRATLTKDWGEKFVSAYEEALFNHDGDEKGNPGTSAKENESGLQEQITALESQLTIATKALETATTATADQRTEMEGKIDNLNTTIKALSNEEELPPPAGSAGVGAHAEFDHRVALFGQLDNPSFALEGRPWNQRAAQSLAAAQGLQIIASSSIEYSKLNADLGDYYRTRRTDAIHSFVRKLPSCESIFPLESGHQDQEALVNLFLGEFSQAFQDDFTAKGGYELEPEILKVYDIKFDHRFTNLKALEKTWIGYLNKEHSDSMKMSFVEYILFETAKVLHNEREIRRIRGVYKKPIAGQAGLAINGANGFLKQIKGYIANLQVKEFALGEPTPQNILEYVKEGTRGIPSYIRDAGNIELYMAQAVSEWYEEAKFKLSRQDTGGASKKNVIPFVDSVVVKVVPNMGESLRMVWTLEGNFKTFEDQAGEMLRFNFEQEDRRLKVFSDWREGIAAILVGKKHATAEEQNYEQQMIWCNDVDESSTQFISVIADETTPSVIEHTSLKTGINTAPTVITDIADLKALQKCVIKCGSDNAFNSSIEKAGVFANMTVAWSPSVGDTITLFKRDNGDIIDFSRTTASTDAEVIAADDATPDVSGATEFITSINSVTTEITTLVNATVGEEYTIYGGSDANATTIADGGEMALTAAMSLTSGKFIKLYCRALNDFVEMSRG